MNVSVHGVNVPFPFEPYNAQLRFMEKVIESCETKQSALLESPTGTGKTLSLLCSSLAWAGTRASQKIIYSSRTHSQLSNVVKELKRTVFRPKVSHIASRGQLCLNDSVKKRPPGIQASMCRELRKAKQCPWIFDDKMTTRAAELTTKCLDIEEFKDACMKLKYCPYLVAQMNSQVSDLILTPYTYIIDPIVREHLPMDIFLDSVLIFDEAHNIPDALSGGMSFELPFHVVKACKECLEKLSRSQFFARLKGENSLDARDVAQVHGLINGWYTELFLMKTRDEKFKQLMVVPKSENEAYQQRDVKWLFDQMQSVGITSDTVIKITETMDAIGHIASTMNLAPSEHNGIEMVNRFLKVVWRQSGRSACEDFLREYFALCLTNEPSISLICFSSVPGFREVVDLFPRTIIMTSGTLSPMKSFADDLGHVFPVMLENEHVADASQIFVGLASRGVTQKTFQFTYANRDNMGMKKELIDSLKAVYHNVPSGVLTFFPSFASMDDFSKLMMKQENELRKKLFVEPRDGNRLPDVLTAFQRFATSGAAMLAVCRGKTSEGLDFADDAARCVCVVGIPFPNAGDFRVSMKRDWLDKQKPGSGSRWYTESAMRAVNQAIGRAIRHKNDYAVILLMDERYLGFQNMLSKWIRPSIHMINDWSELIDEFEYFFDRKRNGSLRSPTRPVKPKMTQSRSAPTTKHLLEERAPPPKTDFFRTASTSISRPAPLPTKKKAEIANEKIAPAIHLKEKPKERKEKVDAKTALTSLFANSMTESQKQEKTVQWSKSDEALSGLFNKKKKGTPVQSAVTKMPEKPKIAISRDCVECGAKNARKKRECGHVVCDQCYDFLEALGQACSACKK